MIPITLTPKGAETAARLAEGPEVARVYSIGCFEPVEPNRGWSLANDVLCLLGGYSGDYQVAAASTSCHDIALAIQSRLEAPLSVLEEVCTVLAFHDLLEAETLSPQTELAWCRKVAHELGHPIRLKILQLLTRASLSTAHVRMSLGDLPPMTVRYHLRALVDAGLVTATRVDRHLEYRLEDDVLRVFTRRLLRTFGDRSYL